MAGFSLQIKALGRFAPSLSAFGAVHTPHLQTLRSASRSARAAVETVCGSRRPASANFGGLTHFWTPKNDPEARMSPEPQIDAQKSGFPAVGGSPGSVSLTNLTPFGPNPL